MKKSNQSVPRRWINDASLLVLVSMFGNWLILESPLSVLFQRHLTIEEAKEMDNAESTGNAYVKYQEMVSKSWF
jgi:hypothetical protein